MPNRSIQPALKNIENVKIPSEEKVSLSNGIPLYKINGGTQDVLKLSLMVEGGAIHSKQKLEAPLTSLMLNEGSANYNAMQIAEAFDFYGANFHPKAEKDFSFATMVTLNKHLEKTLPVFLDVVSESKFPEKEFEVLKQRRKQNYLVDREKTSYLAREEFFIRLFGKDHPYGRPTSEGLYDTLSVGDLFDFYERKYHSGNFSIVVSGKVTDNDVKVIGDAFGSLPIMLGQKMHGIDFDTKPGEYSVVKKDAVQTSIRMGVMAVNKYHYDYTPLKVLVTLFGGYFGSRLMKNIREDKGYTYGIHSMLVSLQQTGYIGIATDVKAEFTQQAIDEIKKEMCKLKDEPVSNEELNLVKNYMMGEMLQMFDGPFASSEAFLTSLQFGFGFSYYERLIEDILTIDAAKIQQLANTYFDLDSLVVVKAGDV